MMTAAIPRIEEATIMTARNIDKWGNHDDDSTL